MGVAPPLSAASICVMSLALCSVEALAARANPFGFSQRGAILSPYTATPHVAAVSCSAMSQTTPGGVALVSRLIASSDAPEHCRVTGTIPAEIGFEINCPRDGTAAYGCTAMAGSQARTQTLRRKRSHVRPASRKGFATARTDTGHLDAKEPLASFAYNRLDKLVDHGSRAVHETVSLAKSVINEYYARMPSYSYWDGCSTGGREGMMSASKYPADFDGIMAGAPTLRWSDVMMKGLANDQALKSAPTLTQPKLANVFKAVLESATPRTASPMAWSATRPLATSIRRRTCPSGAPQYRRVLHRRRDFRAAALARGTEDQGATYFPQYYGVEDPSTAIPWIFWPGGASPTALTLFGESYMKYFAFETQDPAYDWSKFNFDTDPDRMGRINSILNPQPDLAAFKARNGKILSYWGWADAALNPVMGMDYYRAVAARLGSRRPNRSIGCSSFRAWRTAAGVMARVRSTP